MCLITAKLWAYAFIEKLHTNTKTEILSISVFVFVTLNVAKQRFIGRAGVPRNEDWVLGVPVGRAACSRRKLLDKWKIINPCLCVEKGTNQAFSLWRRLKNCSYLSQKGEEFSFLSLVCICNFQPCVSKISPVYGFHSLGEFHFCLSKNFTAYYH